MRKLILPRPFHHSLSGTVRDLKQGDVLFVAARSWEWITSALLGSDVNNAYVKARCTMVSRDGVKVYIRVPVMEQGWWKDKAWIREWGTKRHMEVNEHLIEQEEYDRIAIEDDERVAQIVQSDDEGEDEPAPGRDENPAPRRDDDFDENPLINWDDSDSEDDPVEPEAAQEWRLGEGPVNLPRGRWIQREHHTYSVRQFQNLSPAHIFMRLATNMLNYVVRQSSAALEAAELVGELGHRITLDEMVQWTAISFHLCLVRLPREEEFWSPAVISQLGWSPPDFSLLMPYRRYLTIRAHLRLADYATADQTKLDWKVASAVDLLREAFLNIMRMPGQYISMDEGMIRATMSRCPLTQVMPDKPIGKGIKMYMAVDHATKILLCFYLENREFTRQNSGDTPGGATARHILRLGDACCAHSRGHVFVTDNIYTSLPLAIALEEKGQFLLGTIRANRTPLNALVRMGTAKHPKPSREHPRGKLIMTHWHPQPTIRMYSWMDNGPVRFLDSATDPRKIVRISRRVGAETENFDVPEGIDIYNKKMTGVDANDQMRGNELFAPDKNHRGHKWTVRLFEGLLSMAAANSYLIHRKLNAGTPGALTHTAFQAKLIAGLHQWASRRDFDAFLSSGGFDHESHVLKQTPEHSRKQLVDGVRSQDKARYRAECRACPLRLGAKTVNRETTYFCAGCKICLHPDECYNKWHAPGGEAWKRHPPSGALCQIIENDEQGLYDMPILPQRGGGRR